MGSEGNIGPASSVPIINSLQVVPLRRSKLDETRKFVPVGTVLPFAGADIPDGFIKCDGSLYAIDADGLRDLFAVIGYAYGGTENVDFAVPDLRGRVAVGLGTSVDSSGNPQTDAENYAQSLGQRFGASTRELQDNNIPLPPHFHGWAEGTGTNNDVFVLWHGEAADQSAGVWNNIGTYNATNLPGDEAGTGNTTIDGSNANQGVTTATRITTWPIRPNLASAANLGGGYDNAMQLRRGQNSNGAYNESDEPLDRVVMSQPSMTVNYIIKI